MNNLNGYHLPDEVLSAWEDKLLPDYDIFFFRDNPQYVTCEEFRPEDRTAFSLDVKTSFATWSISRDAKYYSKITNKDFILLTEEQQKEILEQQWLLGRGMLFLEDDLKALFKDESAEALEVLLQSSFFNKEINKTVYMIQGHLFALFTAGAKREFLLSYAALWTVDHPVLPQLPQSLCMKLMEEFTGISPFFDSFSTKNGPNCLAATAVAASNNPKLIEEWMQPERFASILKTEQYNPVSAEYLQKRDVLVWKNQQEQIVHAAYLLSAIYCFNKHGQTMFNPWQVQKAEDVIASWNHEDLNMQVYRIKHT
ncbi:hypothetical protein [Bacillus sp. AK031]